MFESVRVCDEYGVCPLATRIHVDEVGFDICGTLDTTVAQKGQKRVQVVHPSVRIDVRQCSLMLSFFADGRVGPTALCVARTPKRLDQQDPLHAKKHPLVDPREPLTPAGREEFKELRELYPNVLLYAQPKGYFDHRTFAAYWDDMHELLPKQPHVVIMDNAASHWSPHIKAASKQRKIEMVSTPENCTDLCAATDAGLGRSVKLLMRKKFRAHFGANMARWRTGEVSLRDWRHLFMKWLSEAVVEFARVGAQQIKKSPVHCGTGLRINGSENHLVKIDGYEGTLVSREFVSFDCVV